MTDEKITWKYQIQKYRVKYLFKKASLKTINLDSIQIMSV